MLARVQLFNFYPHPKYLFKSQIETIAKIKDRMSKYNVKYLQ